MKTVRCVLKNIVKNRFSILLKACLSGLMPGGTKGSSRVRHLILSTILALGILAPGLQSFAQGVLGTQVVQTFYIPFPETEVLDALESVVPPDNSCGTTFGTVPTNPITSITSISISVDDTIVYYDHHEDGFEADITAPIQTSTEVWGDGNTANGAPPGFPGDILTNGSVILLNNVYTTTSPPAISFDGGDKFATTTNSAVTRVAWAEGADTLLAGALEVFDEARWGRNYTFPVGENLTNASANVMPGSVFEYTGATVMAGTDGTNVRVDTDGDGAVDQTFILNEGESLLLDGGLDAGGTIKATELIQVDLITADNCANFESRWYTLYPDDRLSSRLYSAAFTDAANGGNSDVIIYNPRRIAITVTCRTSATIANPNMCLIPTGNLSTDVTPVASVTVPVGGNFQLRVPVGSGLQLTANRQFTGVQIMGAADSTVDQSDPAGSSTHDWGYTLSPRRVLADQFLVGLGLGQDPTYNPNSDFTACANQPGGGNGTGGGFGTFGADQNGSPIWLALDFTGNPATAPASAQICVDWDNDGVSDPVDLVGGQGGANVATPLTVGTLDGITLFKPDTFGSGNENDQTGAQVWLCDATSANAPENTTTNTDDIHRLGILAGAWGQDPDVACLGRPAIDVGTGVVALPGIDVEKTHELTNDLNGNGLIDVGDTITYTVATANISRSQIPSNSLFISDILPESVTYVPGTTVFERTAEDGTPISSNNISDDGTGTIFPLDRVDNSIPPDEDFDDAGDEDGYLFNQTLSRTQIVNVSFDVILDAALPVIENTGCATHPDFQVCDDDVIEYRAIGNRIWLDEDGDGVQDGGEDGIAGVDVFLCASTVATCNAANALLTVTTDTDGGYLFNVESGDYIVAVDTTTLPAGLAPNNTFDEDDGAAADGGTPDNQTLVTEEFCTTETVVLPPVPIPQDITVFINTDNFPNETSWTLTGPSGTIGSGSNPSDPFSQTFSVTESGSYTFTINDQFGDGMSFGNGTDGNPGQYIVSLEGAEQINSGPSPSFSTASQSFNVTISTTPGGTVDVETCVSSVEHLTADFGYNWAPTADTDGPAAGTQGAIGDRIWIDADGDGVQDAGEAGVPGVEMELLGPGADGVFGTADDAVLSTTTTDEHGNYIFDDLDPDAYQVRVADSNFAGGGALETYTQTGDPDQPGATASLGDNLTTTPIVLGPGDVYVNADFGYQVPGGGSDIGDTVFVDFDTDGVQDTGESGIAGVTVALLADTDNDGIPDSVVATTTTDENGNYLFPGLPAEEYQVVITDTENILGEFGSAAAAVSNPVGDATVDNAGPIVVVDGTPATDNLDQDFGYAPVGHDPGEGAIGDTIYHDVNGDGVQATDGSESGFEGITVQLLSEDGTLLATTVTDENGNYYFGGLEDGDYVIQVVASGLPGDPTQYLNTGDPDTPAAPDSASTVTITGGNIDLDQDFGYQVNPALDNSLSGTLWEDADADGLLEGAESDRFEDVTVALREWNDDNGDGIVDSGEIGNVVATTTTDASGNYSFNNLADGKYIVDVTDTDNVLAGYWDSNSPNAVDNDNDLTNDVDNTSKPEFYPVDLDSAGTQGPITNTNADFGYYIEPASLGNFVWEDDGDGVQQAGEPGIGGVEVTLDITYPNGDVITVSTLTSDGTQDVDGDGVIDPLGFYSFGNLLLDEDYNGDGSGAEPSYEISIDTASTVNAPILGGSTPTLIDQGSDFLDSDDPAGATGQPIQGDTDVPLTNTTAGNAAIDFGFIVPQVGSIGDFVWNDANGDGIQDAGEEGINGTTVNLLDSGGNVIATTTTTNHPTTGEPGYYIFENLPPADYEVEFAAPTGFIFSPENQTTEDLDSDADSVTGRTGTITLAAGEDITNIDAGMVPGGSIGDHIWLDIDGDGVDDIGEPGLPNVTVELTGTAADGTAITLTTVTDVNGDYLFDNLPPGNYTVTVTDTNGELTNLAQSPGNTGSEAVTLAAGEEFLDADFGYVPAAGTAVIGDTVWFDEDGDGIQDPGEVGIAGVTLDLVDENGTVVDTITTDASGNYLFTNVTPGDYTVVVTDTGGVIDDPATNVTSGPQSPGSLTSTPITVLPDDVYVDADFGFTAQTGSTLADRIWYDADGDGVQDAGEPGIGNVTVDLLDSNGVIIASVVTDSNGDFAFTGLPDGDYSIVITDDNDELTGYFPTTPPASALRQEITGLSGDIVNQDPTTPNPVTTGSGTGHPSFGFNQPGTIGDTIWNDANGDGVQDPGEGGLAGVTLTLTDSNGAIVDTAVTDSNGNYLFTNVPAGTDYMVTVDSNNFSGGGALDGYTQTYDADDGLAANDNNSVLSLAPGESNLNQDFGYQNTALPNISGTVFYDVDTDGTHEPDGNDTTAGNSDDENGIAGVTIDLVDSNGNVVATTTTDVNGDYSFPNVPPADYTVEVTDTSSVLDGYELTSGLDILPVSETQLNAGDVTDVDFGYVDDEQTASITSGLWIDSDKDGVRDPDETPIPNVDINLIDCGPDAICGNGDDTIVGTAVTDAQGNVIFEDLPPGVYALDSIESDPDFPADITEIGNYSPNFNNPNDTIQLSEGETYDADFGYIPDPGTAGLSGNLWNDSEPDGSEGDGIQDASEVGLGGIPIALTNIETGEIFNTTTAPDGSYEFTGLTPCAGTDPCYQIQYDEPSVTALGLDGVEPTNTADLGGPLSPIIPDGVNDNVYMVHLEDGDFKEDHDFGFDAPANTFGALEGNVYFEPAPADGVLTAGTDVGIESVTVNLVDSNGDLVATTITSDGFTDVDGDGVIDPAGFYSFTNLVPGDYTVVVTDINNATIGLNPSGDPDEAGLCIICNEQSDPVSVAAGPAPAPVNFGYMGEQSLGNIGNLIWYDVGGPSSSGGDSDGLFDPLQGDKGIAGVTVECWFDADGDKVLTIAGEDNLIRTVTTDENGEYFCEGLPTGGYLVRVTDDAGRLVGSVAANPPAGGSLGTDGIAGTPDDLDNASKMGIPLASIPTSGVSPAWYIQTGSDNLTADFAITGTNSLSGTVFEEEAGTTADGLLNGSDAGTAGVTMILLVEQPDGTYLELTRTTTDANGDYDFTGLPNGNYQVVVDTDGSSINGYGQTGDPDIPTSFCTSALAPICDGVAGSVVPIALTGGTDVTGVDFGYQTEFVTTPITLGYFHAQSLGGGTVEINWQTVTEVAHLGFNLYVRERVEGETKRSWRRLNAELIAPAAPGDSFDTREYTFTAYAVNGRRFAIGDVDVTGKETIHGPFKLNRKAGADRAARAATDWDAIAAKRAAKKQARQAKRKARAEKRLRKSLKKARAKAKRAAQSLKRTDKLDNKKLNSTKQTDSQIEGQDNKEFEMLELENEQCELEGCSGDDVGLLDSEQGLKESQLVHLRAEASLTARFVAGLVAMFVPVAHAMEPVIEPGVIEIETTEAGIYKVTYEDLLEQGVDLSGVLHRQLFLSSNNKQVYIRSWGQPSSVGDRRYFGPGGGFEFVAKSSRTLYSKSNIYTLHVDDSNRFRKTLKVDKATLPVAGSVVDYYQETTVLEPEEAYSTLSPNGDPWFGFQANSSGADTTLLIPYRVDNFAPGKGVVEARMDAWGMTTGSHQVSISNNGQLIDSQQFAGIKTVTLSGEMAVTSLADGVNTFSLTIPWRGVIDQLALDKWQVTYPRKTVVKDAKTLEFEASGDIISISGLKSKWVRIIRENDKGIMRWIPYGRMQQILEADNSYTIKFPGTVETAHYYVSVITNEDRRVALMKLPAVQDDLLSGSASYLIVSHPDFIDANMDRFVAAKQAQGFSVKVADVEAVYTSFGAGHFDAQAIRDYISWARDNLGTEMVLLVGDDMYDYHGNQYPNALSFIPSIYTSTSALVKMAPVDAKYVDFDDDDIPDMPIGRLNPKLVEEWAAMVDKTLNYGGHPKPQSIVFSADAFDAAQGYDFSADADSMLSRMPANWQTGVDKYYIDELGSDAARSGLLTALDNGSAVTAFVGHSGPRDWSFTGLLSAQDAAGMNNNGAPTVVTQWGCWNTYYSTPNGSMANEFLRNPNGGAVAVLGAIALTEAVHEKTLALEVYDRLFVPGMSIGEAILQAKRAYAVDYPVATHKDVILGWTLLADPALVIQQ